MKKSILCVLCGIMCSLFPVYAMDAIPAHTVKAIEKYVLYKQLLSELHTKDLNKKVLILKSRPVFQEALSSFSFLQTFFDEAPLEKQYALLSLIALEQAPQIFAGGDSSVSGWEQSFSNLVAFLEEMEAFYEPIGGIIGYHCRVLELIKDGYSKNEEGPALYPPQAYDLQKEGKAETEQYIEKAISSMDKMAELYVVGGAGDRLNLLEKDTLRPLPAAKLLFEGRTLLEHLIRDLEAREYLYYKKYRKSLTTPIVLMTSVEKQNDEEIEKILKEANWFHRGENSFKRIVQPLVPVIAIDGSWIVKKPLEFVVKPGGHGVVWKLARDKKAFQWLRDRGTEYMLIRQINNPLAGVDHGLLALYGYGVFHNKVFGFNSCPQRKNAAEGMNVVKETARGRFLTNLEYTEFQKSQYKGLNREIFPANTNILFAQIEGIEKALEELPFPGTIINTKTLFPVVRDNEVINIPGARLESAMQNIGDVIEEKSSFLLLNERKKTISVTKKSYNPASGIGETPQGAFFDMLVERRHLLKERLLFSVPELKEEDFIKEGPSFLFFYHPALGPLYSIIEKRVQKGVLHHGAELDLEIAELEMQNIDIDGSLLVHAAKVTGRDEKGFSPHVGRVSFHNVTVKNKGIDREHTVDYWKKEIVRKEALEIILEGDSECIAEDVVIKGDLKIVVPDKQRARVIQDGCAESGVKVIFEERRCV